MSLYSLTQAVGPFKPNLYQDVWMVQTLLKRHEYAMRRKVDVDGHFGPATQLAIIAFQREIMAISHPDGVVNVFGPTLRKLQTSSVPAMLGPSAAAAPASAIAPNRHLTEADFASAARRLSIPGTACEPAAIKAVAKTETGICGVFDRQNRPVILFERHYFSRLTNGEYDVTHKEISAPTAYGAGGYGKCSEQYPKLEKAEKLNRVAALESASWGAFQLMGEGFKACGYKSIDDMVSKMGVSIQEQLNGFVNFILSKSAAHQGLLKKNWAQFAASYNGPGYKDNDYDTKMAQAYAAAGGK